MIAQFTGGETVRSTIILFLSLCLLLVGCMAKRDYAYAPQEAYGYDDYADMDEGYYGAGVAMAEEAAPRQARKSSAPSSNRSAASPPPPPAPSVAMDGAPAPRDEPATPEQPKAERMVHYDGWMQLRVSRVQDTLDAVAKLAEDVGGKVERMAGGSITVAVPVARFDSSFAMLTALGDLLNKSITATDITDQFTSTELRLRTAETTRTRLQELLARATEENEKLQLLREIARLTEQIDLLKSQVELLSTLASFSRITVEALPRQAVGQGVQRDEPWGLGWIQQLSPFRQDVVAAGKLLKLETPEGFVALDIDKRFVAESADGAVLRSGKLLNDPVGDTAFWLEAMKQRLEPEFTSIGREDWGEYAVLRMVQGEEDPYVYIVAVCAQDKWLQLVEVYYPSASQEERYGALVRQAVQGAPGVAQAPSHEAGRAI
jgi:hypothetical protein